MAVVMAVVVAVMVAVVSLVVALATMVVVVVGLPAPELPNAPDQQPRSDAHDHQTRQQRDEVLVLVRRNHVPGRHDQDRQ